MSKRLGIIVDGPGDYAALQSRFKCLARILKTDGPRGHSVTPRQIVAGARKQIRMLRDFRCTEVIVLVDLEARNISHSGFIADLKREFEAGDLGLPVAAASPNRMMENWYLADIAYLSTQRAFLKSISTQKRYEGANGKIELKALFRTPYAYSETVHGPQLFALIRFEEAQKFSASFAHFLNLYPELAKC